MKSVVEQLSKMRAGEETVTIHNPKLAGKTVSFFSLTIQSPDEIAQIFHLMEKSRAAEQTGAFLDTLILLCDVTVDGVREKEDCRYRVNFFISGDEVLCITPLGDPIEIPLLKTPVWKKWAKDVNTRNKLLELTPPDGAATPTRDRASSSKSLIKAPPHLPQPTFYEARSGATAVSDGRDLRDWNAIEGMIAMLHAPKGSDMQTRFEPCSLLLSWWGKPTGAELEILKHELQNLEFDALKTYFVCLSWAIGNHQVSTSLDSIIEAIGRGTDARRKGQRAIWREKIWRWMLIFDSLSVIGARPGTWREPRDGDKKREKMDPDKLYSRDALLKIIGTRATEQGTFDNSAPPKEITFVAGAWVNEFRGNREILSDFGNVLTIARISCGKPSGAWASCIGFALNQKWREQASRAPVTIITKEDDKKVIMQKFSPFTRRILLGQLWRSDVDPKKILDSKDPARAKEYWDAAIEILRKDGIIGIYQEIKSLPTEREGWKDAWLDQPLDIRPIGDARKDAIEIYQKAQEARKRTRKKTPKMG